MVKTVERWVESEPIRYQTERWNGTGVVRGLQDNTWAVLYKGQYNKYNQGGFHDRVGWGSSGEYRIYIYSKTSSEWAPEFMVTSRNVEWIEHILQSMEEGTFKTLNELLTALRNLYQKCNCTLTMTNDTLFHRYLEELYIN